MIYVEQHKLDPETKMPTGSYMAQFESLKDFNDFYKIAKADPCTIINVMSYDPQKNVGQKSSYDAQLFSVSQDIET